MALLHEQWEDGKFVCVGLDPVLRKIPEAAQISDASRDDRGIDPETTFIEFNTAIIDRTSSTAFAFKTNIAFYEAYGNEGLSTLRETIRYINNVAPNVPVILDAKRADIGNTNAGYATAAFDFLNADAITVNPYFGGEALQPFLDRADKGIIVLCRTSNPGAGEFQDRYISVAPGCNMPLYQFVARQVAQEWNKNGNCAVVVGATNPNELKEVREIIGDMPILIPGIGAQGGDVMKTVNAGKNSRRQGMIINASRSIIYASEGSDFAEAAYKETLKLHNLINQYR